MVEYITIGGLDELTTVSGTMYLEVEQDNVSKKIEVSNLLAEVIEARGIEISLNTRLSTIETAMAQKKDFLLFGEGAAFSTSNIASDIVLGTRVPFAEAQLIGDDINVDRVTGGTNTIIYTVPATGFYRIIFRGGFTSTASGYNWRFQLSKNEVYWDQAMSGGSGAQQNYTLTKETMLTEGDTISVFMSQNYGTVTATGYSLRIEALALV